MLFGAASSSFLNQATKGMCIYPAHRLLLFAGRGKTPLRHYALLQYSKGPRPFLKEMGGIAIKQNLKGVLGLLQQNLLGKLKIRKSSLTKMPEKPDPESPIDMVHSA